MPDPVRRLVESRIFWKYLALILALVGLCIYLVSAFEAAFSVEKLLDGLFYAVVTALMISLFYDIGTRRDLALLLANEREHSQRRLTERFLYALDLEKVPDRDAEQLGAQVANSDRMMELIAANLLGEQGRTFFYTWLKPLVDRKVLYSATVENRLCRIGQRTDVYTMEFRQSFRAPRFKTHYFVVFTCDNDLYNDFITASGASPDEMVGTSIEEWADIDAQLASLSFTAYRNHLGSRQSKSLVPEPVEAAELERRLGQTTSAERVRAFDFELHREDDWNYEYSYRVRNRLSDPYYYWTAVNPTFVSKLIIDYRELKPLVGRVSANCILGSASSDPHHDAEVGVYIVNVESLVWPGQGAMIVWRPQVAESLRQSSQIATAPSAASEVRVPSSETPNLAEGSPNQDFESDQA